MTTSIAMMTAGDLSTFPGFAEACAAIRALDGRLTVLMENGRRQAVVCYWASIASPADRTVVCVADTVNDLERFAEGMRTALDLNAQLLEAGRVATAPTCGRCGDTGRVVYVTEGYTQPHPCHAGFSHDEVHEDYCDQCAAGVIVAGQDADHAAARAAVVKAEAACPMVTLAVEKADYIPF